MTKQSCVYSKIIQDFFGPNICSICRKIGYIDMPTERWKRTLLYVRCTFVFVLNVSTTKWSQISFLLIDLRFV